MVLPPKYENINFEGYDELRAKFCLTGYKPEEVEKLEFVNKQRKDLPPLRILKFMTNLKVLVLSGSNIGAFSHKNLVIGAPQLEVLDLSRNKIDVLDDLVELGTLKHLKHLDIRENPVCNYLMRIKIIQFLLFPEKYRAYDPVKILTATYDSSTIKTTTTPAEERERLKYERFMERTAAEVNKKELQKSRVNKYDHKNTLIKKALVECEVPRKTRFPYLMTLNGKTISITDIESITLQSWRNIVDKKTNFDELKQVRKIEHSAQHYKYLEKYKKKVERKALEQGALLYLNKPETGDKEQDEMMVLSQLDQENYNRKKILGTSRCSSLGEAVRC